MIRCPTCGKMGEAPAEHEPAGTSPFCSERCKLRDLGKWLSDAYQIPVQASDEDDEATLDAWVDPRTKDGRRD